MIDWRPFDNRLEGKTSSKGMNFLDYLESKRIRQKSTKKGDPPQPSLLREGANIAETGMISICENNNSLPKQGGQGWVFSFREGWGGVVPKPFTSKRWLTNGCAVRWSFFRWIKALERQQAGGCWWRIETKKRLHGPRGRYSLLWFML